MSIPHTKRVCQVIKLKPQYISEYKSIHANAWPDVLAALARSNISDYSIHYFNLDQYLNSNTTTNENKSDTNSNSDPTANKNEPAPPLHILIATFKYTAPVSHFASDMARIADDPATQRWWKITDGMQESFIDGAQGSGKGAWWLDLPEVFRFEGGEVE